MNCLAICRLCSSGGRGMLNDGFDSQEENLHPWEHADGVADVRKNRFLRHSSKSHHPCPRYRTRRYLISDLPPSR